MNKILLTIIIFIFTFSYVNAQSTRLDFTMQMQNNTTQDAKIYPNPITEPFFNISSESIISQVIVLDLLGKEIVSVDYGYEYKKTHYVKLPVTKKGVYLVKIVFDDNKYIIKKLLYQ